VRRSLLIALVGVLFTGTAAACGDDDGGNGSPEAFCAQAEQLETQFEALDEEDPAAMGAALEAMRGLNPPAEISEQWEVTLNGLERFVEAFEGVDPEDPEAAFEALNRLAEIEEELAGFETAADDVSTYFEEECGLDFE
jgi:hypothetical protein